MPLFPLTRRLSESNQLVLCFVLLSFYLNSWLCAQTSSNSSKAEAVRPEVKVKEPAPAQTPSLWKQNYFLGDWGGTRNHLEDRGVTFGLNSIEEVLGNPIGGVRQNVIFEGRFELALDLDTKKLFDWDGGTFHVNSYYIHGSDLTGSVENQLTASNIEAYDTFRLFDLWYQQQFYQGIVSLRLGRIALDDEFIVSAYGATFINATFGWPALTYLNLPNGEPIYPLAAPGVRVLINPTEQLYGMAALTDGDPADGDPNPQKHDNRGTLVDFNQGALLFFEAGYKWNQEKDAKGLPGTYKLGGFYDTQSRDDLRRDTNGLSLADPASNGIAHKHAGDEAIYGVADQMVWSRRSPDGKDLEQSLGLFCRVGGAPSDRNMIDFYADSGFNLQGLIPGRSADVFGMALGYAKISSDLSQLDRDMNSLNGTAAPVRDFELVAEATYTVKISPWWTVQPDAQFILHPDAQGYSDVDGPRKIPDALILGLRSTLNF